MPSAILIYLLLFLPPSVILARVLPVNILPSPSFLPFPFFSPLSLCIPWFSQASYSNLRECVYLYNSSRGRQLRRTKERERERFVNGNGLCEQLHEKPSDRAWFICRSLFLLLPPFKGCSYDVRFLYRMLFMRAHASVGIYTYTYMHIVYVSEPRIDCKFHSWQWTGHFCLTS